MPASARKQRETAERRAKALALRTAGATFAQIADASAKWADEGLVPYRSAGAACQDITRALREGAAERAAAVDTWVELELTRLDTIDRACNVVMNQAAARGDALTVLRASDRIMRASDRRAALLDLAPGAGRRGAGGGGDGEDTSESEDGIDELARARSERRGRAYG